MDLSYFLNPVEEEEVGEEDIQMEEQILQKIINEYIEEHSTMNQDDDENEPEWPVYTIQNARQAI